MVCDEVPPACCGGAAKGPGYATPLEAMRNGPRESLLYTVLVSCDPAQPDALATIDADPTSSTHSQIIQTLRMPYPNDELHHFGWVCYIL